MILYLDTSSLVKLYVEEQDSDHVARQVVSSEAAATSLIAYAEARAAFARRHREGIIASRDYRRLIALFAKDWDHYLTLLLTLEIVNKAGDLAEKYALRGFDAIHLASAIALRADLKSPVLFSCSEDKLQKAAQAEDFSLTALDPARTFQGLLTHRTLSPNKY